MWSIDSFAHSVYSDAPALSTEKETSAPAFSENAAADTGNNDANEQWDDEALAATFAKKGAIATSGNTAELMDMKSVDLRRSDEDDIAEKLRIEETKAKLAAAKEGMEKEAQRIKEEQEKKEQEKKDVASAGPRFGAAAAGMASAGGGMGSKWLPPHMRSSGGGSALARERLGMPASTGNQKLDTQSEELFPDLAAADAIMEQKKQNQPGKPPKKTPVGGGASWASKSNKKQEKSTAVEEAPKEEATTEKETPAEAPAPTPQAAPAAAAPAAAPIKPKKKKKKDLSTFKPS